MAKPFDYSKWDKIELSDDESDLHPNIDKDSWFRLKHRSRLEREEREDVEIKKFQQLNAENQARLSVIKARLTGLQSGQEDEDAEFEDIDALQGEAKELEAAITGRLAKISEYMDRRAWNTDNICKISEEKTVVSATKSASLRADDFTPTGKTEAAMKKSEPQKEISPTSVASKPSSDKAASSDTKSSPSLPTPPAAATMSSSVEVSPPPARIGPTPESGKATSREKFAIISYNDYVLAQEDLLEKYSEIRDLEDTSAFLFKNCDVLLHEHAQSYMLLSCLEDEMNGKRERMKLVCRQSQILSHITELATSMRRDPRDMILPFFKRILEKEYLAGFLQAVNDFTERIKVRAVEKRKEMDAERAEEEGSRLGPGGLSPFEVLRSLPQSMQDAFESQNVAQLQSVLASLPTADAKKYMKMCVDSGLWVPQDASVFDGDDDNVDD